MKQSCLFINSHIKKQIYRYKIIELNAKTNGLNICTLINNNYVENNHEIRNYGYGYIKENINCRGILYYIILLYTVETQHLI